MTDMPTLQLTPDPSAWKRHSSHEPPEYIDIPLPYLPAGGVIAPLAVQRYIRADLTSIAVPVPVIDAGNWTVLAGLNDVQAKVIVTIYGCEDGLELDDDVIAVCASESITEYPTLRREVDGLDGLYAANEIPAEQIIAALPQLLAQ